MVCLPVQLEHSRDWESISLKLVQMEITGGKKWQLARYPLKRNEFTDLGHRKYPCPQTFA